MSMMLKLRNTDSLKGNDGKSRIDSFTYDVDKYVVGVLAFTYEGQLCSRSITVYEPEDSYYPHIEVQGSKDEKYCVKIIPKAIQCDAFSIEQFQAFVNAQQIAVDVANALINQLL